MKLQFNFTTSEVSSCPICTVYINGVKLECMFDTGANIGVACTDAGIGLMTSLSHEDLGYKYLSGFGKDAVETKVVGLNNMIMSDGRSNLFFRKIAFSLDFRPVFDCDIILPSSMFRFSSMFINYKEGLLVIESDRMSYTCEYNRILKVPYVRSNK